jgi:coproporphyrinogen III oxidase
LKIEADAFYATGVSIVLHAHNPWVPTIHMNIRYFEAAEQRWFGGGIDLTPSYVDADQARLFHTRLKGVCDRFSAAFYPDFKRWADDYFYLPHRDETRGIGGIFYDRLGASTDHSLIDLFDFTCAVGRAFAPLYAEVAAPGSDKPFTPEEKAWQQLRRGRYVEFNLVHDRGTKFGLETGGRTESILMSLPPGANWIYDHRPAAGTREAETLSLLRKGVDWI